MNDSILLHDLFEAYFKARKNKRNKKDQVEFEQNFESSVMKLHNQIVQREFKPQNYTAFVNKKPVIREVFAPSFRDRVVHHLQRYRFTYRKPNESTLFKYIYE